MLRDAAVAQIQQGLGFRGDLSTQIVSALQFVQDQRETGGRSLPWFLKVQDQSLAVLSGVQETALPSGFIQETDEEDANLRYRPTATGVTFFLKKTDFTTAEKFFYGDWMNDFDTVVPPASTNVLSPGTPKAYVLRDTTVRIYPIPDKNYTLLWDFYKHADSLLSSNIENAWLANAPWCLIGEAGLKLASDLRDATAAQTFSGILQGADQNLISMIANREHAGRGFSMGARL